MPRFLLTHSLLASWLYSMNDNPYETTSRDAFSEFMSVLHREPTPTTEAMQRGIDFEDLVTAVVEGRGDRNNRWYHAAENIAQKISGGVLQYRVKKTLHVRGIEVLLYGRLDALKAGVIYDIKFSGSYEVGKFISSTQHPIYFELIPEAQVFTYLISDGNGVWSETYRRDESADVVHIITDFFDWLDTHDLMGTYQENWVAL